VELPAGHYGSGVRDTTTQERIPAFRLDPGHLGELAAAHRPAYAGARPFPHAVIDDFLPGWVCDAVLAEFPAPGDIPWSEYHDAGNTLKLATDSPALMGPFTRSVFGELNGAAMLDFLEALTGIEGLIPDPHLAGGGLHQIESGGYLNVHADFNLHPRLRLDRQLNLLLYLNHDWTEADGGHLELWSAERGECERRVLPVFNRCVVFNTTDMSLHGHPQPLAVQPPRTRKSLALYYYSAGRPARERSAEHSTLYRGSDPARRRAPLRRLVLCLLPPVAADAIRAVRRRRAREVRR